MKCVVVLFVLAVAAASVNAAGTSPKPCLKKCDSNNYKPVCGIVGGTKEKPQLITFGSQCVLENYQCETGKTVPKLRETECDKGTPVRLA